MNATSIEMLLECTDLDAMVRFFVDEVGLRIETISPADDPHEFILSGSGAIIRLRRSDRDVAGHLIVRSASGEPGGAELQAPNGTVVEFASNSLAMDVPPAVPALSIVRSGDDFGTGRAGMEYRDILPGRWGGRFIASHIRIGHGGDVPDYVHFHRIRFQMIFCARGWVDVVYEDQGEPIRLVAGDCFLQPPEIRHRVLRSSPGLEVIEVGCPAVHDTVVEHEITLPNDVVDPDRKFGGQRFVHHVAAAAERQPFFVDGLAWRDTGIAAATDGLAGAIVIEAGDARSAPADQPAVQLIHEGEFVLLYVLEGSVDLGFDPAVENGSENGGDIRVEHLHARDAVAIPAGINWSLTAWDDSLQMLQVTLPADSVGIV